MIIAGLVLMVFSALVHPVLMLFQKYSAALFTSAVAVGGFFIFAAGLVSAAWEYFK